MKEDHALGWITSGTRLPRKVAATFSVFPSSPFSSGGNIPEGGIRKNFCTSLSIKEILGNNTSVMVSIMRISLTGPQGAQTSGQTALWVCLPGYFWNQIDIWTGVNQIALPIEQCMWGSSILWRPGWNKRLIFLWVSGDVPALPTFELGHRVLLLWDSNSNIGLSEVSSLLASDWKQTVNSPGSSASQR